MPPPPVPLATFVADLQAPGVTLADAEQLLVELIDQRRLEGAERYRLGKELEILVREVRPPPRPARVRASSPCRRSGLVDARSDALATTTMARCPHTSSRPSRRPKSARSSPGHICRA